MILGNAGGWGDRRKRGHVSVSHESSQRSVERDNPQWTCCYHFPTYTGRAHLEPALAIQTLAARLEMVSTCAWPQVSHRQQAMGPPALHFRELIYGTRGAQVSFESEPACRNRLGKILHRLQACDWSSAFAMPLYGLRRRSSRVQPRLEILGRPFAARASAHQ